MLPAFAMERLFVQALFIKENPGHSGFKQPAKLPYQPGGGLRKHS
jgi:hypothetical protein